MNVRMLQRSAIPHIAHVAALRSSCRDGIPLINRWSSRNDDRDRVRVTQLDREP